MGDRVKEPLSLDRYAAHGMYIFRPGETESFATSNTRPGPLVDELNTLLDDARSMREVLVRAGSPEHRPGAGGAD